MMDDLPEWTTREYLANIAADELHQALTAHGIAVLNVSAASYDDHVMVSFGNLDAAASMLVLAVPGDTVSGSLYDRAAECCITLSEIGDTCDPDDPATEKLVRQALAARWEWTVHPAMRGRQIGWHVSVDIPVRDAGTVTAILNGLRNGGVL